MNNRKDPDADIKQKKGARNKLKKEKVILPCKENSIMKQNGRIQKGGRRDKPGPQGIVAPQDVRTQPGEQVELQKTLKTEQVDFMKKQMPKSASQYKIAQQNLRKDSMTEKKSYVRVQF